VVVQYTDIFNINQGSLDSTDIIDQFIYYEHLPCVDKDTTVFYDAYEHEIHGHNNNLQSPTIIPKITTKRNPDYTSLRPLFGCLSPDILKKACDNTIQYARIPTSTLLKWTL
jgi:hypothetical protein